MDSFWNMTRRHSGPSKSAYDIFFVGFVYLFDFVFVMYHDIGNRVLFLTS